jgi:hypothetical protein
MSQKALILLFLLGFPLFLEAATFRVDRSDDVVLATACTDEASDCSLRGALIKANQTSGPDTILIPADGGQPDDY